MKKILFGLLVVIIIIAIGAWYVGSNPQAPAQVPQPIASVMYACNGGATISAAFYQGTSTPATSSDQPPTPGGSAQIALSDGRSMTLAQTISADGARYANSDESFVFWSKGNGALVLENGVEKNYVGCIAAAPEPAGSDLSAIYENGAQNFSIRLPGFVASSSPSDPQKYTVNETYRYQEFGPGKDIGGVKFTIPSSLAAGTNLSTDSYVSVEQIPQTQNCTAALFLPDSPAPQNISDGGTDYSVASSTGAGAGNRYAETVYALPGTNPCIAVRYFIHYGVIENYPTGAVQQFDEQSLTAGFDAIRRTLVINE